MTIENYKFWDVIGEINWRGLCKDKNHNKPYDISKERLNQITNNNDTWKYQIEDTAKAYRLILEEKLHEYSLKKYNNRYKFPIVSNDTLWDLTAHIVGCGKEVYNSVMRYPQTIEDYLNEYVENFEYTFN